MGAPPMAVTQHIPGTFDIKCFWLMLPLPHHSVVMWWSGHWHLPDFEVHNVIANNFCPAIRKYGWDTKFTVPLSLFMYGYGFLSRGFSDRREILHGGSATSQTGLLFCGIAPEFWASTGVIWRDMLLAEALVRFMFNCYKPRMQRSNSFSPVCLSVCPVWSLTFECRDAQTSFLVRSRARNNRFESIQQSESNRIEFPSSLICLPIYKVGASSAFLLLTKLSLITLYYKFKQFTNIWIYIFT